METSIRKAFMKYGIKGALKYCIQRAVGMQMIEEEIDTIHYYLNAYFDISQFPGKDDALEKLQRGDTLLLAILDNVLRKHGLEYWMDGGTILGAVRHGGFIPWDDDADICIMRDDYEKARLILPQELGKYGIEAIEPEDEPTSVIGVGYKHKDTGLWVDIIPCEWTSYDTKERDSFEDCSVRWYKFKHLWDKKRRRYNRDQMFELRKKIIPRLCGREEALSVMYSSEMGTRPRLWPKEDIFPLRREAFNDIELNAPNNIRSYLTQLYGPNYMMFPHNGVKHHGDERGTISEWAKFSGEDMDNVISELENILQELRQQ